FTWDAASIRAKVEARRQAGAAPVNIAAEKQRLRRLLEAAEAAHDDPEVARLEGLLRDLDARAIAAKPGDARNFGLSHVNKRNQQANFNLAFKNVSNKPRTEGNVTSGAGDSQKGQSDPFSRRTTRPTIYWNTTGSRGGQAGGQASQATDADPNGQVCDQSPRGRVTE
ncbi:Plus3 domain-containing protein, partial [Haematococcus lacustris]